MLRIKLLALLVLLSTIAPVFAHGITGGQIAGIFMLFIVLPALVVALIVYALVKVLKSKKGKNAP